MDDGARLPGVTDFFCGKASELLMFELFFGKIANSKQRFNINVDKTINQPHGDWIVKMLGPGRWWCRHSRWSRS